jgi:hypothetical protein
MAMSVPGPAASIISPMIDWPPTSVPLRSTQISASNSATSLTNFAAARACRPRWLQMVTLRVSRSESEPETMSGDAGPLIFASPASAAPRPR